MVVDFKLVCVYILKRVDCYFNFFNRLDHLKITTYSNTKIILEGLEEVLFISLRGYLMMIV